jgi:integrase
MKDYQATRTNGEPYRGVRYREHPSRKHGLHPDRYYFLKFRARGRTMTEGVGWASEGTKPSDAHKRLIDIKAAIKAGTYETPAEKKAREESERAAQEEQDAESERAALTFGELFKTKYLPHIRDNRRNPESVTNEEILFKKWVDPVLGERPLAEIAPLHLEKIKSTMLKAGRAPRTARYALELVRQVFNHAMRQGLYAGENPVSKVKIPSVDNRRMRFLSREEAEALLDNLAGRSKTTHDIAALSLYAGLRFGEITALQWGDVDLERGTLLLRDTKSGKTRAAFINEQIKAILASRPKGKPTTAYVFPDKKHGGRIGKISSAFGRAVNELKLNEGIEDRRQKFTFHGLRHTFASWLVEDGTDLYTVKELLGHADFAMAARYSHVGAESLRAAVNRLDKAPQDKAEVVEINK